MDTIDRTTTQLVITGNDESGYLIHDSAGRFITGFADKNDANRFAYEEERKSRDPQPWINPGTMERFAEEQFDTFCVYSPRIVWPTHGGRMVRRDYLRPGDRAVSSHYGPRIVETVRPGGDKGQTTTISWQYIPGKATPFIESYLSEGMIELLPEVG